MILQIAKLILERTWPLPFTMKTSGSVQQQAKRVDMKMPEWHSPMLPKTRLFPEQAAVSRKTI